MLGAGDMGIKGLTTEEEEQRYKQVILMQRVEPSGHELVLWSYTA